MTKDPTSFRTQMNNALTTMKTSLGNQVSNLVNTHSQWIEARTTACIEDLVECLRRVAEGELEEEPSLFEKMMQPELRNKKKPPPSFDHIYQLVGISGNKRTHQ